YRIGQLYMISKHSHEQSDRGEGVECSFLPKFSIHIETKYEDNNGSNDNIFGSEAQDVDREVCFVDIAYDEVPERYYKESEDLRYFKSEKTSRGLLKEGWRDSQQPIMCSYKLVTVKFEVWGLQTRVEQFVHKVSAVKLGANSTHTDTLIFHCLSYI
ncbi:Cytoplasmic phosphatidylinositol transfer protein 1, partial [Acipenser ruthenus]